MGNSENRYQFAHLLRGLAALSVIIGHLWHNSWYLRDGIKADWHAIMPSYAAMPTPWYLQAISLVPHFDWGAFGVAVFFLISGAVIPLSLQSYSRLGFAIGRVIRLWPVYAVGFSVSISAFYVSSRYFHIPFDLTPKEIGIHYLLGLRDQLWSRNIDGIIWTLEVEIKFYLVCVIFAGLIRKMSKLLFLVPVALFMFCLVAKHFVQPDPASQGLFVFFYTWSLAAQMMIFMFIGTAYTFWREKALSNAQLLTCAACLPALFFTLDAVGPHQELHFSPVAYAIAMCIFFLSAWRLKSNNKVLIGLANISYPLYASHAGIGFVSLAIFLNNGITPFLALLISSTLTMVVAMAIHLIIERPSHLFARSVSRHLSKSRREG